MKDKLHKFLFPAKHAEIYFSRKYITNLQNHINELEGEKAVNPSTQG